MKVIIVGGVAGAFLIKADASAAFVRKLIHRLAGKRSEEMLLSPGQQSGMSPKASSGLHPFSRLQSDDALDRRRAKLTVGLCIRK